MTTPALARPRTATALGAVMIAALLFIAVLDIGPLVGIGDNANAILTLLAALIFVVAHGCIALGWRNFIAFSLITVVISFTSEAIGVATGLIFGAYHYTALLGFRRARLGARKSRLTARPWVALDPI